jgi:hypothetical protein
MQAEGKHFHPPLDPGLPHGKSIHFSSLPPGPLTKFAKLKLRYYKLFNVNICML